MNAATSRIHASSSASSGGSVSASGRCYGAGQRLLASASVTVHDLNLDCREILGQATAMLLFHYGCLRVSR